MESLRLMMGSARSVIIQRQQYCGVRITQSQRLLGYHPGMTTTCLVLQPKKNPNHENQQKRHFRHWNRKYRTNELLFNRSAIFTHVLLESDDFNRKRCFRSEQIQKAKKTETTASTPNTDVDVFDDSANLGLFARFKLMYKKYWYVLIPVHVVTSIGWFGGFYYLSKSGVDIPAMLHHLHMSQALIEKMQSSDMGHYAIAYLMYKIATPVRYFLTLGGTTVAIKVLGQAGRIKPVPSKTEFIAMYEKKKDSLASKFDRNENDKTK